MPYKKILVVDDEQDFVVLMKDFFAKRNYEVHIACSLADGMAILEKERPDHLFLDNNLPDGLGWSKTDFILIHYPATQLHLISAWVAPKTTSSSFQIFHKPSLPEVLIKMFGVQ